MILTKHALRACRAVARLIRDNSITDIEWQANSAFDGGEWSQPAMARHQEQMETRMIETVALRFGYMPSELEKMYFVYVNTESDLWFAAMQDVVRIHAGFNLQLEDRP
jgi:hypothetical protein